MTPTLARDRCVAYELYPEDMDRVAALLYGLRTQFRRYFNLCMANGHLIPIDSAANLFLLIHEFGKSKVGLRVQINEAAGDVTEVSFYFPRSVLPMRSNPVLRRLSGVPDVQEQQRPNDHEDKKCTHRKTSLSWVGYDLTRRRCSN